MEALRQLVQDIRGLVGPATLLAGVRPDLAQRLPEAERTIGHRKLRRHRQAAAFQIEQQIAPRLGALAQAIGKADQLLLALRRCADDHQDALRLIFEPRFQVDAVDPDIDVPLRREIALLPAPMLLGPHVLEAGDGRGREPRRVLADQGREHLLEVSGRDALQIEDRDQNLEARGRGARRAAGSSA